MVHILDLDDDSLYLIFEHLHEYCPFTSLVCLRFCERVTRVHFPYPRRAKAGVLMHRTELANCYRGDRRLINLFLSPRSRKSVKPLVFRSLAHKHVIFHGTVDTVESVVGVPECEQVLRAGRADLLDEIVVKNVSNKLSAAIKFFAGQVCVSAHYGTEINAHCSSSLILACGAPSSSALRWIDANVHASRLSSNSNWAFIWSELSGVSKRAVLAAASSGSEDTLDLIMELFVEHAPSGRNLIFEGVCAHVILSHTRSAGAWRWLRRTITQRKDTLDSVLKRIVKALQNREPTHTPRTPSLLNMNMGFVTNNTFKVKDVESYQIVKEGIREGGWLRRAYFDTCGYGSNFTSLCLFCNSNAEHRLLQTRVSLELEALFVQCAKDTAEDYVRFGTGTLCFVVKALKVTSEISVEVAYDVTTHVAELELDGGEEQRRRDELLYNHDLLNVVLVESIKKSNSAIVQDIVSRKRLFNLDRIEPTAKFKMVSCASASTRRTASMKTIAECVAAFCHIDKNVMLQSITRRNCVVFRALVKAACPSVRAEAGKAVLNHPSVDVLEAAIDEQCFARDSPEERRALELLSQHELDNDAAQHRRVLPSFTRTVPWKVRKLHHDF